MTLQYNLTTDIAYQGKNQDILASIKEKRGYKSNAWVTFLQAKGLNKKLVGAKGKGIFLRTFTNESVKDKKGKIGKLSRPVGFVVFNFDHLADIEEEK